MKQVLIVIGGLGIGGGERSLINLLNLFDYQQYSVDLLVFNQEYEFMDQIPHEVNIIERDETLKYMYNSLSTIYDLNFKTIRLAIIRLLGTGISRLINRNINQAKQYRWLHYYKKNIKQLSGKYKTVFAFMNDDSMYYVADKIHADHKIAWIHNDYYAMGYDSNMDRKYLSLFDKVVTISDECLQILVKVFPEYKNKFMVIPNLTSSQTIIRRGEEFFPEEYKGGDNRKILLSIGRLSYQKGYDLAIKAAAKMKKDGIKFIWFILGDGELRTELEHSVKNYGIESEFKMIGIRTNPYPYLKHCNIFIQPSRFEGKSVALDEAKIFGKPIVATKYPTVYDQLNEQCGILTDMTESALAEGIESLINNEKLQMELSNWLRENVLDNKNEIQQYYDLIK